MDIEQKRGDSSPLILTCFSTVPQLLAIALTAYQFPSSARDKWPVFALIWAVWGASAVTSAVFAIRKSISQRLVLVTLIQGLLTSFVMMALTYPMPRFTHVINLEAGLLLLVGAQAAGLCHLLARMGDPERDKVALREVAYGFLLPSAVATMLAFGTNANPLTDFMMCGGIGAFCLAALYFGRWLSARLGKSGVQPAPEQAAVKRRFYRQGWFIVTFAIIFPIAGLMLNRGMNYEVVDADSWVYPALALMNGVLMLPDVRAKWRSLPYLYFLAVGFSFIAYFAVIFIPLTLAGILTILVGLGLLILSPVILFIVECGLIRESYRALRGRYSAIVVAAVLAAGMLTIPVIVGANMVIDRVNYQNAVTAVNEGRAREDARVDTGRLAYTINQMNTLNHNFEHGWTVARSGVGSTVSIPLYEMAYQRIVFDAMPMSYGAAHVMRDYYYADRKLPPGLNMSSWSIQESGFSLTAGRVRTEFDEENGVYLSWIDLEIAEQSSGNGFRTIRQEFKSTFALPNGNYITDYSLYVGQENKQGLLSEKRAANMVYNEIVSRKQDPGIVTYTGDERVQLKVFPFARGEIRKTSLQIMHIQPLELDIDGEVIELSAPAVPGRTLHVPMDMGKHGPQCDAKNCGELLPYQQNRYDNAMVLTHNSNVAPDDMALVVEAFRQRVLTPRTSFIVLESAQQEQDLRLLQQRILNGDPIPERFVAMSEPGWLALAFAVALWIAHRYSKRRLARR